MTPPSSPALARNAAATDELEPPRFVVDLPPEIVAVVDEIDETVDHDAFMHWLATGEGSPTRE